MKRLIIIVEGDTEKGFVSTLLIPHFNSKGFYNVQCFKIKHSRGGLSKYEHVRKDLRNAVNETDSVVTTLLDFYALPADFPQFEESKECLNKSDRLDYIEQAIKEDIELNQAKKFDNLLPYIQLHEFEALIFSSISGIKSLFDSSEADFDQLSKIVEEFPNPEDINEGPNTAPSKRLLSCIKGYNKVIDGVLILDEIGLSQIRIKCLRFNRWLSKVEKRLGL